MYNPLNEENLDLKNSIAKQNKNTSNLNEKAYLRF